MKYIYIFILIIILLLYLITQENFESCKIVKCATTHTNSINGKQCCLNKDNVMIYNDDCSISYCNIGYTLSNNNCICNSTTEENDINKIISLIIIYWNKTKNPIFTDIDIYEAVKSTDINTYHVSYTYKQTSNNTIYPYRSTFIYEITKECKVNFINDKILTDVNKYIVKQVGSIYFKPNQYFKRLINKKNSSWIGGSYSVELYSNINYVYKYNWYINLIDNRYLVSYLGFNITYLTYDNNNLIFSSFSKDLNQEFTIYNANNDIPYFYIYNNKLNKYLYVDNNIVTLLQYNSNLDDNFKWKHE